MERTNEQREPSIKRTARVAGVLYLMIFLVFPLATLGRSTIFVAGDAAATAENLVANDSLLRWGIVGESVVFLIEVVLAALLYVILRPVSRSISLAAALARVGEAVIQAANLLFSFLAVLLVGGAGYLAVLEPAQLDALALLALDANELMILVWGLFFALHLALLGWLVYKSGFFPRILGVLLALAGTGYFVESFGKILTPDLGDLLSTVVLVLAIPGELVFALWLVIKRVDEEKWHEAREVFA